MVLNGKHEAIIASFIRLQYTGSRLHEQSDTLGVSIGSCVKESMCLQVEGPRYCKYLTMLLSSVGITMIEGLDIP